MLLGTMQCTPFEALVLDEEVHRLRHRVDERLGQVLVESDHDVVGGRFDARPGELLRMR
jgi:hypothetical protein